MVPGVFLLMELTELTKTRRKPYTIFNRKREGVFIQALAECGNVSDACKAAFVNRETAYEHKRNNAGFATAWDDAIETAIDRLEKEAIRRGRDGVNEPVFYQGEECGVIRKYSDSLLALLLKAHRPEKYRENVNMNQNTTNTKVTVYIPENGRD